MMSVAKGKGPIFDPGMCRCCGTLKRCRLLNVEYQCMGQKEIYADMIMDCFGLLLSHLDDQPSARLVCATCVARLREAVAFRAQVLRCEAAFLQLRMGETEAADQKARLDASALLEVEVKHEPPGSECGDPPDPGSPGPGPDDPGEAVDPPDHPTDGKRNDLIDEPVEKKRVKCESPVDSDDVPLKRRKRRTPDKRSAPAKLPPKPVDAGLQEDQEERRMSPEDEAELWKHRGNIKNLLEFSNATPIRCFSGVGYRCCYCSDVYPDPKDLKTHTLTKHDVKIRRFLMQRNLLFAFLVRLDITGLKCRICEIEMDSIERLMQHLKETHEKKIHMDVKSHLLPFKFDDGLKCVVCAKIFTKFRTLQEHMNVHFRNYICDDCETGYPTKRMLVQHCNMHKTGVFNCEHCPKTFNTEQKRKLHERFVHVSAKNKFLNKCGVCKERFKSYRVKEHHMLQVHGVSSAVKCQACEKSFKNQRVLTIHVQRDHLMQRPHKCPLCDMSFFGKQELNNHSVKHTGLREFRCKICSKAYGRQKTLREHMRIHEERRFKCELCGVGFVQRCSWRGHMKSKHKLPMHKVQQIMRERDPSYMIDSNVVTIVECSYVCPFKCRHNHLLCYYCGANYSDPNLLRQHTAQEHHPKKFKVIEHKKMIKMDLTRIDCRLCSEKISDIEEFKRHVTTVHKKKYYFHSKDLILPFRLTSNEQQCALCDEVFPYFHALNKHMNKHFSNYVCETCGLGFVDKGRFVMHQQRHEEGDFPCDTCGKIFKAQYNRDLHIDRVHNKRGRVFCPKCDLKLMSYTQKLKHLVEVHGDAPLTFPCPACERVFGTRRTLTIHRRKDHLKDYRYECQFCGQKFFTRFALNNHMPTHTRERNFKCKVCEKTYPRLKTLKDHMRIHTNDRRYRCHVCGQAFIQNCSLKGHMKSQHSEYG